MAIDNNYTSATYDGYITVSECDTLTSGLDGFRDLTAYGTLSSTQKENLIKYATREANRLNFVGSVVADVIAQDMQWPRNAVYYLNDELVSITAIPDFVKRFTAFRVLELIENQLTATNDPAKAIKKVKIGELETEYQDNKGIVPSNSLRDLPAFKEIAPWVVGGGSSRVRAVRG